MKRFYWLDTVHHGAMCVNVDFVSAMEISEFNPDHTVVHITDMRGEPVRVTVKRSMLAMCNLLNGE